MRQELELKIIKEFSGSICFFRDFLNNTQHGDTNSEHSDQSDKTTAFTSATLENENCELSNKEDKNDDVEDEIDNVMGLPANYWFEILSIMFQLFKFVIKFQFFKYTYES